MIGRKIFVGLVWFGLVGPVIGGQRVVLVGNGLGERMNAYGFFETEAQLRHAKDQLFIRNMRHAAITPAFRPHPSRKTQWAFPGAEQLRPEFNRHSGVGHYPYPDEWLKTLKPDLIVALFGFNESFDGPEGVETFKKELDAFIQHTLSQNYNGTAPPKLILVSPIAFEDLSRTYDLPNGQRENANLAIYTDAMQRVAEQHELPFVDLFTPTLAWFAEAEAPLTVNGCHLNEAGYRKLAPFLADAVFGKQPVEEKHRERVHELVQEKNWLWMNDYQMLNGVHVYGRRYKPYGNVNYPDEIAKIREMTEVRERAIWAALKGEDYDVTGMDRKTRPLKPIKTNAEGRRKNQYIFDDAALQKIQVAEGYKVEQFASSEEFKDLANPVQMSFDNQGRLWIATMPSYPHYRPGDAKPEDKILILEDT
ncbi:MAG: GDSL-type esterase/lipase family protein, partial [Verrucomicrobiota bacterium]